MLLFLILEVVGLYSLLEYSQVEYDTILRLWYCSGAIKITSRAQEVTGSPLHVLNPVHHSDFTGEMNEKGQRPSRSGH